MPKMPCEHENFRADVEVGRIKNGESGPVEHFLAEVTIKCTDCGEGFEFMGVPAGLFWTSPSVSIDGQKLTAPIRPWQHALSAGATFQVPPGSQPRTP